MIAPSVKRFAGFSWRWNHLMDSTKKPVLVVHDASQRVLVEQIWRRMGTVSFDWAGNTPWLDRELPGEPLPVDSPEQTQLLDYAVGDYEQAMVLLLYGQPPARGDVLAGYLRRVSVLAKGARVLYADRQGDRAAVWGYAADAGVEYLDCGNLTEEACAEHLAKLLGDQIEAAGEPRNKDLWVREPAEWTHVSFDTAQDALPRVLLVGDSISNGYGDVVRQLLDGQWAVDQLQTSEGMASPKYLRMLDFMMDCRQYAVVHWNMGLHPHGATAGEYELQLQRSMEHVLGRGIKVIFATTTPTHRGDDLALVDWEATRLFIEYNQKAAAVCARLGASLHDLYALALQNELPMVDSLHFAPAGYGRLGQAVAQSILAMV